MLLGIDIGTSSIKAVLYDPDTLSIVALAQQEYPISKPTPDRAEQHPDDWWNAVIATVRLALSRAGRRDVIAIGLCGQMHGLVALGADHQPLHPAVIWADQRSSAEVRDLIDTIGARRYVDIAGTLPATGFMASTLAWISRHDPALLDRIDTVLLPKDYVRLKLTGSLATDPSDAAGTGLFDVRLCRWSPEIIIGANLPHNIFPPVLESQALAGELTRHAAEALSLPLGIPVIVGCADQAAVNIGNGICAPGSAIITIGTGGQVATPVCPETGGGAQLQTDPRLHVFNHAIPNMWYILGAILSAGLSLRWLREVMGMTAYGKAAYELFSAEASAVTPGSNGLIFLPYLSGERTPHMDSQARGGFIGLNYFHERGHMARAVMEGVAFALRQTLDISTELGGSAQMVVTSGSGTDSETWRQILADIIGLPMQKSLLTEQTGIGAAVVAGVGIGVYSTFDEACVELSQYGQPTEPRREYRARYDALFMEFKSLYPRLRDDFHTLSSISANERL